VVYDREIAAARIERQKQNNDLRLRINHFAGAAKKISAGTAWIVATPSAPLPRRAGRPVTGERHGCRFNLSPLVCKGRAAASRVPKTLKTVRPCALRLAIAEVKPIKFRPCPRVG
jgi:hypothetical protein